ncbi:hypothetical protein BJ165DRAFT_1407933 [Panaeolus papilionaceus]|nr:hypothetical protein BJ165DRAFT_1407933 [Panaeolus papilionaceus]
MAIHFPQSAVFPASRIKTRKITSKWREVILTRVAWIHHMITATTHHRLLGLATEQQKEVNLEYCGGGVTAPYLKPLTISSLFTGSLSAAPTTAVLGSAQSEIEYRTSGKAYQKGTCNKSRTPALNPLVEFLSSLFVSSTAPSYYQDIAPV